MDDGEGFGGACLASNEAKRKDEVCRMEREWYGYLDKKIYIVRRRRGGLQEESTASFERGAPAEAIKIVVGTERARWRDGLLYLDNRIVEG